MNVATDAPRYHVPALQRGLQVLQMFDRERSTLSPPEIARDLRLPRTTVFRLLQTLEDLGYVERVDGRAYRVGAAAYRHALESLAMLDLAPAAHDLVTELRDRTGCSVQLAIRDRSEALVVFDAVAPGPCNGRAAVGARLPAHACALGRSLLLGVSAAELANLYPTPAPQRAAVGAAPPLATLDRLLRDDRLRGYVLEARAQDPHTQDIAAPVRGSEGEIVAAVGLTSCSSAAPVEGRDLARRLLATADAIGARLTTRAAPRMASGAHR